MPTPKYLICNALDLKSAFRRRKKEPRVILTSPPYFDLLNYESNNKQIGFGSKNYSNYIDTLAQIFQDCYDISAPDATFWLVVDTFKKNQVVKLFPFDIVNRLKEKSKNTWKLRDVIIWDKEKNLPWSNNGNLKNQHEYILFFTKSSHFKFKLDEIREITDLKKWWKTYPERYSPNGKAPSNIWTFTTPIRGWGNSKQNHLCPFPFPLVEKILTLTSDEKDLVFDPFAGSGSVLAIAHVMKRAAIGLDVNKTYQKRFDKEVLNGAKIYWKKRNQDILETKGQLKDFKETNKKLRKLKVATKICEEINKMNKHKFIYYTKNKPNNDVEIIVMENGRFPRTEFNSKVIKDLVKQSKINPIIKVLKEQAFVQSTKEFKAFKYKFEKFYSYTSPCKITKSIKSDDKYAYFYSNIAVKIRDN